jgi:hypothetical protein
MTVLWDTPEVNSGPSILRNLAGLFSENFLPLKIKP